MNAAIDHGSRRMLESSQGLASVQVEFSPKLAVGSVRLQREGAMWQLVMERSWEVRESHCKVISGSYAYVCTDVQRRKIRGLAR